MQGRISRLRRSLSRSVLQLQALHSLSRSNNHLPEAMLSPNQSSARDQAGYQLVEKFAAPSTFAQLRQTVQANNDNLREVISILNEKAELDLHYSNSMHKLAARLHKLTQKAECEIDKGWTSAAEQFGVHAAIHSNLAAALTEDVVQPLKSIQMSEEKSIRATNHFVDRQLKKLNDKKADVVRTKKQAYTAARELERLEQAADADRTNPARFDSRRKKLAEIAMKAEEAYVFESIDQEKLRRFGEQCGSWSGGNCRLYEKTLRRAVLSLEAIERQRLAHSQTALGRLQRQIEQLVPALQNMFDRQTNNLDVAIHCSATAFISSLSPSSPAANQIILIDTFAENQAEIMRPERRADSLQRLASILDNELQRMYLMEQPQDNSSQISLLEYVEYLYYKVSETLASLTGKTGRVCHPLTRYQHFLKDRLGLPHSVLTIPLSSHPSNGEMLLPDPPLSPSPQPPLSISTPPSSTYESYHNNTNDDIYEKISDDDIGISNRQNSTIINDPATGRGQIYRVLYDFTANSNEELGVLAGDRVMVEDRVSEEWLLGRLVSRGEGSHNSILPPTSTRAGRFPASYVALCN